VGSVHFQIIAHMGLSLACCNRPRFPVHWFCGFHLAAEQLQQCGSVYKSSVECLQLFMLFWLKHAWNETQVVRVLPLVSHSDLADQDCFWGSSFEGNCFNLAFVLVLPSPFWKVVQAY